MGKSKGEGKTYSWDSHQLGNLCLGERYQGLILSHCVQVGVRSDQVIE